MNGILGKKIGMTSVFDENRKSIPVTVIQAGPCKVTQVKTPEIDGYTAVQVAFDPIEREKLVNKPQQGHFQKVGMLSARFVKEFRLSDGEVPELGSDISVDIFEPGDPVKVTARSKGKGFLGAVGRHGFGGGPASHGSKTHRRTGSIGQASYPARVRKGQKMPGHTGHTQVTISGLRIVDVDKEQNLLLVSGAVPGPNGGYVIVKK